jgi:hypothetical protein
MPHKKLVVFADAILLGRLLSRAGLIPNRFPLFGLMLYSKRITRININVGFERYSHVACLF